LNKRITKDELKKQVNPLLAQGLTMHEVAQELGIGYARLIYLIHSSGLVITKQLAEHR